MVYFVNGLIHILLNTLYSFKRKMVCKIEYLYMREYEKDAKQNRKFRNKINLKFKSIAKNVRTVLKDHQANFDITKYFSKYEIDFLEEEAADRDMTLENYCVKMIKRNIEAKNI